MLRRFAFLLCLFILAPAGAHARMHRPGGQHQGGGKHGGHRPASASGGDGGRGSGGKRGDKVGPGKLDTGSSALSSPRGTSGAKPMTGDLSKAGVPKTPGVPTPGFKPFHIRATHRPRGSTHGRHMRGIPHAASFGGGGSKRKDSLGSLEEKTAGHQAGATFGRSGSHSASSGFGPKRQKQRVF